MAANIDPYVNFRMREWGLLDQPRRLQSPVRRVLNELCGERLLDLKDPRLEVVVTPDAGFGVWAYFPIHRRRLISRELTLKPTTRVLLLLRSTFNEPVKTFEDELRDHFGHTLLYLRSPKAWNDCTTAWEEWKSCVKISRDKSRRSQDRVPQYRVIHGLSSPDGG